MTDEHAHELGQLLGAYALDAVTDEERAAVEQYLLANPRARVEVRDHREVAGLLAWSGTPAPDGVWERIAARLDEPAPPPTGELAAILALDRARGGASRTGGRSRRPRWAITGPWFAVAAAAAVVAVLVVTLVRRGDDEAPLDAAVAEARSDRDSRVAKLVSVDGREGGEAIIDADGHGFLIATDLPVLADDRTWQLWGVVDGEAISLGILGHAPEIEVFTVEAPVTQLVVTNEVAGGVMTNGNPDGAYGGAVG